MSNLPEVHQVPNAWYEQAGRLESISAIAEAISSVLEVVEIPERLAPHINKAVSLAGAIVDLVDLAKRDSERIELELKTGVPQ